LKVLGDPGVVKAIVRAGVPVFAEFHGEKLPAKNWWRKQSDWKVRRFAPGLQALRSVAGPAVVRAVSIPVIGGLGGGPCSTGACASRTPPSAMRRSGSTRRRDLRNAAKLSLDAFRALIDDVRSGRQIRAADMPTALIDGIKTNYEVIGNGPPLLMYAPAGSMRP